MKSKNFHAPYLHPFAKEPLVNNQLFERYSITGILIILCILSVKDYIHGSLDHQENSYL